MNKNIFNYLFPDNVIQELNYTQLLYVNDRLNTLIEKIKNNNNSTNTLKFKLN